MVDLDRLLAHLADAHDLRVEATFTLEEDVVLVRDRDSRRWVVRVAAPSRPLTAVEGDAAVLAWLAREGFPAERVGGPVSALDGRGVLLTEAVSAVPRARRRAAIKDAGGLHALGRLVAALNRLEPAGAARRPGGAWHHMADGRPAAELAVAGRWLAEARERAPVRELATFDALEDALAAVDDGEGLPEALDHPDPVLANLVAATDGRLVLVDWAGAGWGPRLWPLAFLLWAEASRDPRRADRVLAGYLAGASLTADELERLPAMLPARSLIFDIWRLHHGARAPETALARHRAQVAAAPAIAARVRAAAEAAAEDQSTGR